jgi:hypothetical protein
MLMARLLPHGPLDVLRQALLFYAAYHGYSIVRGLANQPGVAAQAFDNGRSIIELQRTLGIFVEPHVQVWFATKPALIDLASWLYVNAQSTVLMGTLVFFYFFRNPSFYFVRNMLMVAMGIALVGYLAYPTAPPRFFPEWGFHDAVADFAGVEPDSSVNTLFNPYAAMPSMHVAFALMLGWSLAAAVRSRVARIWWQVYPLLVVVVIVATANHFLLDAFMGALAAGAAALTARQLGALRPAAWRFGRTEATVG